MISQADPTPPNHSKTYLVVHASWATTRRLPLLTPTFDVWARHLAPSFLRGARILAMGNSDDHMHVVLRFAASTAVAGLIGGLKGGLSRVWNASHATPLRWQEGYWAETCTPRDLTELLEYVRDQRDRHRTGVLLGHLEPSVR